MSGGSPAIPSVTIRPARRADRDAALRLWMLLAEEQGQYDSAFAPSPDAAERWATEYDDLVGEDAGYVVVAEIPDIEVADGEGADGAAGAGLVGLAVAHLAEPAPIFAARLVAFLDAIVVAPAWRRRGIAGQLVAAVEVWARGAGARSVEARVVARNAAARAFWASRGARETAVTVRLERP